MHRPLAVLVSTAVAATGLLLGAAPAHASVLSPTETTGIAVTWRAGTIRAAFDYSTYDYGKVELLVDGAVAATRVLPEWDDDSASLSVARAGAHGSVAAELRVTSCDAADSDPASCETTSAWRGTLLPANAAPRGRASAVVLLDGLTVRSEAHAASYARTRFGGWIDRDRDGENTRAEVLKSESRITASLNRSGTVKGGKWISAYDNRVLTKASRLDVDHMVPLAEAWASGAWKWSAKKRQAYANDLGYGSSLIAVSLSSNRSKGDRDPAQWLPPAKSDVCTYVKQFIAVKSRWKLSIDRAEKAAMTGRLATCANLLIAKPAKPVIASLLPKAAPKPKPVHHEPVQHTGGGSSSTYYANCTAVRAAGAAPLHRGQPGYESPRLDRDGDGVACE